MTGGIATLCLCGYNETMKKHLLTLVFLCAVSLVPGWSQALPQPPADFELGAVYDAKAKAVEFRLWAPLAKSVSLLLFDKPLAAVADSLKTLTPVKNAATGVWTVSFAERDPAGLFYEYRVDNGSGEKRVLDPWAKAMEPYKGKGFCRAAVLNPAASDPVGGWQGAEDVKLAQRTDAVIYEVSVRDLTISPDSGVAENLRGTYTGFIEKIPDLKKLGITHVQLMPVLNFMYNDETNRAYDGSGKTANVNYNWGYGPHNYFTPEGWFSTDPSVPDLRVRELKTLIRELHKAGIGVLLDVVYNHFGTTAPLDDVVPGYFFRKTASGALSSDSYCGNDINTSAPMVRKMIHDSLVWWASEYKVDGFRFDLMGLIDTPTILEGLAKVRKVPGKQDILFQGEGWNMYKQASLPGGVLDQKFMTKTNDVAVFNDDLRNLLKGDANNPSPGFITGNTVDPEALFFSLIGLPPYADSPGDNIQCLAVHDGMDLHDAVAWTVFDSQNQPYNRDEVAKRVNLGHLLLLTAQGIPILHAGQEKLRTKPNPTKSKANTKDNYTNNSYNASDNINQIPWKLDAAATWTQTYATGLIALRKSQPIFRLNDRAALDAAAEALPQEAEHTLAYSLKDGKKTWFIVANGSLNPAKLELPVSLAKAKIFADGKTASATALKTADGVKLTGQSVELGPLTGAVILVE